MKLHRDCPRCFFKNAILRFQADVAAMQTQFDAQSVAIDAVAIAPRKSDLDVREVALLWTPWAIVGDGFRALAD